MTGFQEIQYESNDGLKLYARDYTKEGSKLTILCMHGLTRSSADFEDLAPLLQEEYRVITVDQRGRGESDWDTNPSNYTTPTYVGDMFSLIDALSLENIVMIGTSMGGFMAMMMNSMKPALFAGLVLSARSATPTPECVDRTPVELATAEVTSNPVRFEPLLMISTAPASAVIVLPAPAPP